VEPNDRPAPRGATAWHQRALVPRGCAPLARSARIGSGIERSARSANGRPPAVTQVVAIAPRVTAVARFGTIWVQTPDPARGPPRRPRSRAPSQIDVNYFDGRQE